MKYTLTQKIISIGNDFVIYNENKEKVLKIDGKVLTLSEKLHLTDTKGNGILTLKKKLFKFKDTYIIERDGETIATLKKDFINLFKDKFILETSQGNIRIKGNFLDYNYKFKFKDQEIVKVSKKFISIRDSYIVDIKDFSYPEIILCSCIIIDMICHNDKEKSDD